MGKQWYLPQQCAVLTCPSARILYAVQPLGQTAGLKAKRLSGTTSAHPGGWHTVKRGSATSDTVTVAVVVVK